MVKQNKSLKLTSAGQRVRDGVVHNPQILPCAGAKLCTQRWEMPPARNRPERVLHQPIVEAAVAGHRPDAGQPRLGVPRDQHHLGLRVHRHQLRDEVKRGHVGHGHEPGRQLPDQVAGECKVARALGAVCMYPFFAVFCFFFFFLGLFCVGGVGTRRGPKKKKNR